MTRPHSLVKFTDDDERLLDVVFDVLATYRLTTLVKDDNITEDIRSSSSSATESPATRTRTS